MKDLWVVYGLVCKKGSDYITYIGITNNFSKRFEAHKNGTGAKFTKAFKPVYGAVLEYNLTKSGAAKREHVYKKLSKNLKIHLINTGRGMEKI